jgi:hypothetical protein
MLCRDSRKLFFIIAPGRSGTTLLRELMTTFPGFCNRQESRIPGTDGQSCWTPVRQDGNFSFLERFINERWVGEYFVEKTPDSILCLPAIADHFPDANFVFLERHPLRIVLSQLNMFPPGGADRKKRAFDVANGIMKQSDLTLPCEQFAAKRVLTMIEAQVREKPRFTRRLTIRYEDLVRSLDAQLARMRERFEIEVDVAAAQRCLSRLSASSRRNRYDYQCLTDPTAQATVAEACRLWNYDPWSDSAALLPRRLPAIVWAALSRRMRLLMPSREH